MTLMSGIETRISVVTYAAERPGLDDGLNGFELGCAFFRQSFRSGIQLAGDTRSQPSWLWLPTPGPA